MRFIEYDGDMMILAAAKINEEKNRKQHSDSDEDSKGYRAENLSVISIRNEVRIL